MGIEMEASHTVMTYKQRAECSHNPVQELREAAMCEAQARITWDKTIGEVVEKMEMWRKSGTHLVSDEAIRAIKGMEGR